MDKTQQIESLVMKMMSDFEEIARDDETYHKDIRHLGGFSIQWDFAGTLAYQVLGLDNYSYGMGDDLDDPEATFTWSDADESIRFLEGEPFEMFRSGWHSDEKGGFTFFYVPGIDPESGQPQRKAVMYVQPSRTRDFHPYLVHKLPMFRKTIKAVLGAQPEYEKDFGSYIPINKSLETADSETLPRKVFQHFFNKASNIYLLSRCPCRVYQGCEEHDHSIGCIQLGDDTLKIKGTPLDIALSRGLPGMEKLAESLPPKEELGRFITNDEALEVLNKAMDDGLMPLLGKIEEESLGYGFQQTGHFMSMCFCCSCCCVNVKAAKYASVDSKLQHVLHRMDGVTVEIVDKNCNGCELCIPECNWNSMEMVGDKAVINQDSCLGCGRCEEACDYDAINITIDDDSRVHQLIKKLESVVDVTPQQS